MLRPSVDIKELPVKQKIAWIDSVGLSSRIHIPRGTHMTICGHIFYEEDLSHAPVRKHGRSNYCRVCFLNCKKSVPWHPRCEQDV